MKKAIRVLLLSNMGPSKNKPNSGRFIMNQYTSLKKYTDLDMNYFYLDQEEKSGLLRLFRYPFFYFRFLFKYIFSMKKLDIIHVHFFFPNVLLAITYKMLRNWKVKIIVTFHGSDIYSYYPPSRVYKKCINFVDESIFVSDKLKERFFKQVPCTVQSAGVNDIFYQKHEKCTFKDKQFDVVFVGQLDKNKGIERLKEILLTFPCKIRVAIVGAGNSEFIEQVKNNQDVSISYFSSCTPQQLVTIYNSSSILINLSYNESFGLVMSEAMACGALVVATRTDGASTQVVDGKNGFLIPNQDDSVCSSAINAIQHILTMQDEQYTKMSDSAISSAQKYRLSVVTEQIFNMYAKLQAKNVNDK
ncbi:glycosyltransferase family 4 protein [Pseudoalteromonas aliena]|uniref:glycosyltransferase family 4 protein n=1 Tax=Pseudoalteromonas aliena TaxID=247523 RepID=UPI002494CE99|nr:glycosyltransferase family 4 protein [Pseudoalteromonas aliena]